MTEDTVDDITTTACPACGKCTLRLEFRFGPLQIGEFSLSGQQMKFSTVQEIWLVCDNCKVEAKGHS